MDLTAGIPIDTFAETFTRVPAEYDRQPARSFDLEAALGNRALDYVRDCGHSGDILDCAHKLPASVFSRLTPDQRLKLRFSSPFMLDEKFTKPLDQIPRWAIVEKVRCSMWKWGMERSGWNEIIDAIEGICALDMALGDFSVQIDYARWRNGFGRSEFSQTFLDGTFGAMIHYRGQHVMTVGFSFAVEHRLLIQQVQLASPRGNRWLFKFPANRLEYIIGRFRAAFPAHLLFVADGGDVARRSLSSYTDGRLRTIRYRDEVARSIEAGRDFYNGDELQRCDDEIESLSRKMDNLRADIPRLKTFYRQTGSHVRTGEVFKWDSIRHYLLA